MKTEEARGSLLVLGEHGYWIAEMTAHAGHRCKRGEVVHLQKGFLGGVVREIVHFGLGETNREASSDFSSTGNFP